MGHEFGGPWTIIKLDVLKYYLRFYTTALKNQNFKLAYIDAFAGSGECHVKSDDGARIIDGSAKVALDTHPSFDEYYFIEMNSKRRKELSNTCASQYTDKPIYIHDGDANEKILNICSGNDWRNKRAVMFLDPYGLNVDWATKVAIAKTKAIDLWYLFPLSSFYRQAAKEFNSIDEKKIEALNRTLGTDQWKDRFYTKPKQLDMFGEPSLYRDASYYEMLEYVKEDRLKSIFADVASPLILRHPTNRAPLFALFFAVSNRSPKAVGLSMKVANHILKYENTK